MNQLVHIFVTYSLAVWLIPSAEQYFWPIVIFSIIPDVDHIPGYIKMLFMSSKKRKKMKLDDHLKLFRTAIQEPIGILITLLILNLLWIFGLRHELLFIAGFCILTHWVIDFLTVHTQPYNPVSKKVVSVFFHTSKQRITSEIIATVLSGILFVAVLI